MKKILTFLNSQLGTLILGFLLTTIVGTLIADRIQKNNKENDLLIERERQNSAWQRDKKYELFRRKLDDGEKLIDELSNLMNVRFFKMQNTFINISSNNITPAQWNDYYRSVEDWNVKMPVIRNKIKRLLSDSLSMALNNYETDDPNLSKATSIHGMFYLTHRALLNYYTHHAGGNKELKTKVNEMLRDLDFETDNYIDVISDTYLKAALNFEIRLDSLSGSKPASAEE